MGQEKRPKLREALDHLAASLKFYDSEDRRDEVQWLAVAKAFEVAVEYAWKELKTMVEAEGLEALSPKEAIRQAAKIGIIHDAEKWLDFVNTRNISVHDYYNLSEEDYLALSRAFFKECREVFD